MNKSILTVALVAALGASAYAQTTPAPAPAAAMPAAAPAAAASPLGALKINGTFDYESQYVYRGKKVTNSAFQPSIKFSYPLGDMGTPWAQIWTSQPIAREGVGAGPDARDEIDLSAGYTYDLSTIGAKGLSVDVGDQYYWYPQAPGNNSVPGYSDELHILFTYDTTAVLSGINLSPTLEYYHDVILDQNDFEAGLSYTWDMSSLTSVKGLSLAPSFVLGWVGGNHEDGSQTSWVANVPGGAHQNWRNSYVYYTLMVNLNYQVNDWCSAFVGVRYAGNNDGNGPVPVGGAVQAPGTANSIWGGAGLNFGM